MSVPDQGSLRSRVRATHPVLVALLGVLLLGATSVSPSRVAAFAGTGSAGARSVASDAPTDPGTLTFYGRGYGHGVGMSQYGARGRALAGQDAATILGHYYQGTSIGRTDPTRAVRVLVLQGFRSSLAHPLRLYGRGGPWTIDGIDATFPRDAQLRVSKTGSGFRVIVRNASGGLLLDRATKGSLRVRAGGAAGARIQVWSKPSSYDSYRGAIRLRATASGIDAINETQLDLYLRGVVPAEMPAGWPAEALKAQAIAARSYAAHRLHPRSGFWDLYDDTRTQVYRGSRAEQAATNAAIAATAGQVVKSGTSIANTLFFSTGGGATEDNENVFTSPTGRIVAGPVPYLRGSLDVDPAGTPYDAGAPRESWQTASYTLAQLSAVFGTDERTSVGQLSALDLSNVGVSGRLISVTLTGSLGTKTVSGAGFRAVFNSGTPATDPYMWSTLVATSPIP